MNHVFLEEQNREKIADLLNEGVTSQAFYRNRTKKTSLFQYFVRGGRAFLKTKAHLMFSKKKYPAVSQKLSKSKSDI